MSAGVYFTSMISWILVASTPRSGFPATQGGLATASFIMAGLDLFLGMLHSQME
jgi:hypothetical protein